MGNSEEREPCPPGGGLCYVRAERWLPRRSWAVGTWSLVDARRSRDSPLLRACWPRIPSAVLRSTRFRAEARHQDAAAARPRSGQVRAAPSASVADEGCRSRPSHPWSLGRRWDSLAPSGWPLLLRSHRSCLTSCLTLRMQGTGCVERWQCDPPRRTRPSVCLPAWEVHRATGTFQNKLPWRCPRRPCPSQCSSRENGPWRVPTGAAAGCPAPRQAPPGSGAALPVCWARADFTGVAVRDAASFSSRRAARDEGFARV